MISLVLKYSISTFSDLQRSEIMLLAQWLLATSAGHLPSEALIAVFADRSWTGIGLHIDTWLCEVRVDVYGIAHDALVKLQILCILISSRGCGCQGCELWIFVSSLFRQRYGTNPVLT